MQEMTMVERVARAIYEASPFRDTAGEYDDQSEIYRRMCRLFARAAIEAMRTPTIAMIAEGNAHDECAPYDIYESMIDAALSE